MTRRYPRFADLPIRPSLPPMSAWGLWGDSDTRGTLNFLDADSRAAGLASVRSGQVFPLEAPFERYRPPLFGRARFSRRAELFPGGRDEVLDDVNLQVSSHWDALAHVEHRHHGYYNNQPVDRLGIDNLASTGLVTRGVLIDIEGWCRRRGESVGHEASRSFEVADLVDCLAEQGASLTSGSVVVLHTGWNGEQFTDGTVRCAGLRPSPELLEYIWDHQLAALAADNPTVEPCPIGSTADARTRRLAREDGVALASVSLHQTAIPLLGLMLGEMWATGDLVEHCRTEDQWSFLLTSSPIHLAGSVAAPCAALAVV